MWPTSELPLYISVTDVQPFPLMLLGVVLVCVLSVRMVLKWSNNMTYDKRCEIEIGRCLHKFCHCQ